MEKKFKRTDEGIEWSVVDADGRARGKGLAYTYGMAELAADAWLAELAARQAARERGA